MIIIPQFFSIPVKGGTSADYHPDSFWHFPWGKSGTHKGIDIFAKKGASVVASTSGFVLHCGNNEFGGNVILILGPKWRLHYYAHLNTIKTTKHAWVWRDQIIGSVGSSGNAAGKEPHLHYSIVTAIPYLWRIDFDPQGWKKMFYLDPTTFIEDTF